MYDVDDPLGPVELHCPKSVPLGSWVECNGSLIRGTRINTTFSFEDGQYESISLSELIQRFSSTLNSRYYGDIIFYVTFHCVIETYFSLIRCPLLQCRAKYPP